MSKLAVTEGKIDGIENKLKHHNELINILVVVLFVGFAGVFVAATAILVDAFNNKQATYQVLVDKINDQKSQNQDLIEGITGELKIIKANQINRFDCVYQKGGLSCQP